jgi:WD40 repeat protein
MADDSQNGNAIIPEDKDRQLSVPSEIANRGLQLVARIELQRNIQKYQKPIRYFPGIDDRSRINFSKNGCYAAIFCLPSSQGNPRSKELIIWDVNTGSTKTLTEKMHGMNLGPICSAALSCSGDMALTSYKGAIILIWDVKNSQIINKFKIDDTAPISQEGISWGLNFSPDDQYFAAGNFFHVTIREIKSGQETNRFRAMIGDSNEMAFSDDGNKMVIGNTYFSETNLSCHTMSFVDIRGRQQTISFKEANNISSVSLFPDNLRVLSINGNGIIAIWDVNNDTEVIHWSHFGQNRDSDEGICSNPGGIAVSRNGLRILSGNCDGYMRLWNLDGQEICNYHFAHPRFPYDYPVIKVAFLPDSQHALSGFWDGSVCLWELPSQ